MTKHFENLWEDAEQLSLSFPFDDQSQVDTLIYLIEKLPSCPKADRELLFGEILFLICSFSARMDTNTYTGLIRVLQNKKSELLDPG